VTYIGEKGSSAVATRIMPQLEVPGASLYYETLGTGPMLLCISGANGSADIWKPMAKRLEKHFTIAMYDRRGYSRSLLSGAQDYSHRLETDADDAERLIRHLSPEEPATVIGSSSGGLVSLELLLRHPDAVRNLLCHEPPAMKLLPDCEELMAAQHDIYQLYRKQGVAPAAERFAQFIKAGSETPGLLRSFDPKSGSYNFANSMYWFERELPVYGEHDFHIESFKQYQNKLLLLNSQDSDPEAMQYRSNVVLSEQLGLELHIMPGGHVGYAVHAPKFAQLLYDILKDKDSSY